MYKDGSNTPSISRQQVFWIVGGVAVGLGGFALYYQRKKVQLTPTAVSGRVDSAHISGTVQPELVRLGHITDE